MAFKGDDHGTITLVCTELSPLEDLDEIEISTAEVDNWDLPSILTHSVLKIRVDRSRLIQESSYFRGLLLGRFRESGLESVAIHWNLESFLSVLRFIFGCQLDVTSDNFVTLYEAALFFGVETLLSKCQVWLDEVTSFKGLQPPQLSLNGLIYIWKYGLEHANDFILQPCTSYLARNFMWVLSFNSFNVVPHELLCSCTKHPDLTVDSEKQLCDVILVWFTAKAAKPEGWSDNVDSHMIRINLLPLWFAAGIDGMILSELMSGAGHLRSLCLSKIQLVDDALYRFQGSYLQMLDVSDTKVSCNALSHVICRNLDLKFLKTRGCTQLAQEQIGTEETQLCMSSFTPKELFSELGKSCQLEEIELGWGFSFLSLGAVKPAIRTLKTITIGLGASLGPDGLKLIPTTCPLLEMVILYFQWQLTCKGFIE